MTDDTRRPQDVAFRLERGPTSDYHCSVLLEVFELGTGPIDTGKRHAVWLHHLKAGGYRWECSCGAGMSHHELDAALLAKARTHFDQVWKPMPSPIWHPIAIWTDRSRGERPPSTADLEQLARELAAEKVAVDRALSEPLVKFCRGEGCPRADLCRRHMDARRSESPTYFERSPLLADGQCSEFVSSGWLRKDPLRCGGAHPPPRCAWQCSIVEEPN